MLDKNDSLSIGNVSEHSTVNQANGNMSVTNNSYGIQLPDVIPLVHDLVQSDLALYKLQAEQTATTRLEEFAISLEETLSRKVADKISKFSEPAMQFATKEAASGYIKTGDQSQGEALIDLLIERIQAEERSSKQMLIDEAIRILPKLSHENITALSLITYGQLRIEGSFDDLRTWIECINPVIDAIPKVSKLDIEFLVQVGCISTLIGFSQDIDWVLINRKNYPLAFCSPIDAEFAMPFMKKHGIEVSEKNGILWHYINDVTRMITLYKLLGFNKDGTITPKLLKKEQYSPILSKAGLDCFVQDVDNLLTHVGTLGDEHIISFYEQFNPNWRTAIKLLNEKCNKYVLKPVGAYIGSRHLSKLYGKEVNLDIFIQ